MYSVFHSNIITHLDSFWQMKLSFLISNANKNIYIQRFVPHLTVAIMLVRYDLLLKNNCGFRTGYFSYKAERSEQWASAGRQLPDQQHWPKAARCGGRARSWEKVLWLGMGGVLATKGCGKNPHTLAWHLWGTLGLSPHLCESTL